MTTHIETGRSAELYERALAVLPGGVSRNTVLRDPHPAYVAHAEGCRIVDVDGFSRIDFANNMASMIHGHAHPAIVEAVTEQVRRGTAYTLATEVEVGQAFVDKLLVAHVRGDELVSEVSMAKWWTTDLQKRVATECLQLHGGYGYMLEYPIAQLYADSRGQKIYGGANEVMKEVIARTLDS